MNKPQKHRRNTEKLARKLDPCDVYDWLVTVGYFPEGYVLPPCFHVTKHPVYGTYFSPVGVGKFHPKISQVCEVHFPKTELTDRTFGFIDPQIHSDIAYEIANNWQSVLDIIFDPNNQVSSYSFPIPVSSKTPGAIGGPRAGRMIYEWIEMAENDLVEEAYAYKYLVMTDVKNFYPSIYTHSIAWAIHSRFIIRSGNNRNDYSFFGNRLDKLFQNANDGCTNGLPIGPAVSDFIAEVILSAMELSISSELLQSEILSVRFKDDYRFLCRTREDCIKVTKILQRGLKEFNLLVNEDKTKIATLPEGIFREWPSRYYAIRPEKGKQLTFQEFKELYLGVLRIDQEVPGSGIVERFIADITDSSYAPLFPVSGFDIDKTISLLLLLAERRIKSFPRILGLVEAIMIALSRPIITRTVERHLNNLLDNLSKYPEENRYLISWILYFLKSNGLKINKVFQFTDPILKSIQLNRCEVFTNTTDFQLFREIHATKRAGSLLKHLDVFKPQ
jgi:hypothetical protein